MESQKQEIPFYLIPIFSFFILLGGFLAVYQTFAITNMWVDEAMVALNIVTRSFAALLKPLELGQVAPIGFLFMEKFFTLMFGANETALRIYPLLSFLFAIPLFFVVSDKLTESRLIAYTATAIFSVSFYLIKYAAEVKQYSSDVLVCVTLTYLVLHYNPTKSKAIVLYSVAGMIAVWFSNVTILLLATHGSYLVYTELIKKRNYRTVLPILFWVVSFVIYYALFIHNHPTKAYMLNYWSKSFLPLNPLKAKFYIFLGENFKSIYFELLSGFKYWMVICFISIIGIFLMLRLKQFGRVWLLVLPILIHLLLSGLRMYPFSFRLILYLVPIFILLYVSGLQALYELCARYLIRLPTFIFLLPVLIIASPLRVLFPSPKDEMNEAIGYIQSNSKKGEDLYVYYASIPGIRFYQQTKKDTLTNRLLFGTPIAYDNPEWNKQINSLKGKVWMIFSHINSKEESFVTNILLQKGGAILEKKAFYKVECYYFDTRN